jgi:hypothetical protein
MSEEFNVMQTMNRWGKPINLLAVIAIATTGMSTSALAGTDITTSQGSWKLAQAASVGQCRAAKVQIPVFKLADVTSEAIRLLSPDEQVTLAANSVDTNGFISISTPVVGFVQAANLKPCGSSSSGSTGTTSSTPKELCRRVVRPPQGLLIRREPSTSAAQVGSVYYLRKVTLTTNPATVKQADNRDWVEIAAPVKGWVSNGLESEPRSNLAYCP